MKYKYVKEVTQRKSFPDFFFALGCKFDWKEYSEIYSMYQIVVGTLEKYSFKPDIVYDIGCGKRPTLGTFLALNVKSMNNIICIDPSLNTDLAKNIKGLELKQNYLSDFVFTESCKEKSKFDNKDVLILCNHSHVSKKDVLNLTKMHEKWIYITCPCCIDNKLDGGEFIIDKFVDSPKNIYYISRSF